MINKQEKAEIIINSSEIIDDSDTNTTLGINPKLDNIDNLDLRVTSLETNQSYIKKVQGLHLHLNESHTLVIPEEQWPEDSSQFTFHYRMSTTHHFSFKPYSGNTNSNTFYNKLPMVDGNSNIYNIQIDITVNSAEHTITLKYIEEDHGQTELTAFMVEIEKAIIIFEE